MSLSFLGEYSIVEVITPIAVALVFITLMSPVKEPMRRSLMAILVAGAGATYISGGGMGAWEFPFTAVVASGHGSNKTLLHLGQPRGITGHRIDLEVDIVAFVQCAESRHA